MNHLNPDYVDYCCDCDDYDDDDSDVPTNYSQPNWDASPD